VSDAAPGFPVRGGLALAAPCGALALADDPRRAGKAAGDLVAAMALVLLAAHTRELVAAGWIAVEVGPRAAAPAFLRALSGASMFGLIFVLVASLVVSLGAGARRHLGRDFDLACVAALAPVTVTLAAALWSRTVAPLGSSGRGVVLLAALGWGGALTALAVVTARRRHDASEVISP
jgi:hypothetical protein